MGDYQNFRNTEPFRLHHEPFKDTVNSDSNATKYRARHFQRNPEVNNLTHSLHSMQSMYNFAKMGLFSGYAGYPNIHPENRFQYLGTLTGEKGDNYTSYSSSAYNVWRTVEFHNMVGTGRFLFHLYNVNWYQWDFQFNNFQVINCTYDNSGTETTFATNTWGTIYNYGTSPLLANGLQTTTYSGNGNQYNFCDDLMSYNNVSSWTNLSIGTGNGQWNIDNSGTGSGGTGLTHNVLGNTSGTNSYYVYSETSGSHPISMMMRTRLLKMGGWDKDARTSFRFQYALQSNYYNSSTTPNLDIYFVHTDI